MRRTLGYLGLWAIAVFVVTLVLQVPRTSAAGGVYGVLAPTREDGKGGVVYLTPREYHALLAKKPFSKIDGVANIIDTLWTIQGRGFPYFGGSPGDTFAVYFNPGAGCYIKQVGFNAGYWANNASNPLAEGVNVSIHSVNYDGWTPENSGKTLLGEWTDQGWQNGNDWYAQKYNAPPLGPVVWGDLPVSVTAEPKDVPESADMSWLGYEPDVHGPFAVALVAFGSADKSIGFEDIQEGDLQRPLPQQARLWKYYISDGKWYVRTRVGFEAWAVVEFYENTPPTIAGVNQLGGTYDVNKQFKVTAEITDVDASDVAKAGVAEAYVVWKTTSGTLDSAAMSNTSGDIWEGYITGLSSPDTVTYWVSAKDKGDPPLYSMSPGLSFVVGQRNPKADLLVVFQGPHNREYYTDYLDENGFTYDLWNISVTKGIDASVTTSGYGTVLLAGWGCTTIPTRGYEDNAYAALLQGGGNLFLSDMDYLYANGEPADTTFSAGDFAYDFFGLAGGMSDPGANVDSLINGVEGDPISGDWANTQLALTWYAANGVRSWNWIDYVTPGNATSIFKAQSDHDVGVRYDNGFKTVFLAFMADALTDTTGGQQARSADFDKLLGNVLNWFGTQKSTGVAESSTEVPTSYSLSQNYPNPFNPTTTIEFSLAKASKVQLSVYNMLGQKVATLVNGHRNAGHYKVTFDASDLPSGVYFYKLVAGDYQAIHKMVLTK